MTALNHQRQTAMIKLLSQAVDSILEATELRGISFDGAVKEYAEQADNELSRAFKEYVRAMGRAGGAEPLDERRDALLDVARRVDVPEVTTFANTMIEAQYQRFSLVKTLRSQSEQLHQTLLAA